MIKIVTGVTIVLLLLADYQAAHKANNDLLDTDVNFEQRLSNADLNISGPREQSCIIDNIYLFYWYQTCFILIKDDGLLDMPAFDYVYHKPKAIFLFYSHEESSLYFREPALGKTLKKVNISKTVIYSKTPKRTY